MKRGGLGALFFTTVAITGFVANLDTLGILPLAAKRDLPPFSTDTALIRGTQEEARAFAEPILAGIANVRADLEDDFSTENERWQWELEEPSDKGVMQIQAGVMRISGLFGRVKVRADALSEIGDFVLKVDARLVAGGSSSRHRIYIHTRGPESHFAISIRSADQTWRFYKKFPGEGSTIARGFGEVTALGGQTELMAIVRGDEGAIYLNGEPVAYVKDPDLAIVRNIRFHCLSDSEAACEFDNVKLWELSSLSSGSK